MDRVVEVSERYGLILNTKEIKFMIISKNHNLGEHLIIKNKRVEQVQRFKYLGTTINEDCDHSLEIKCRIERAREAFRKMSKVFKCHDLSFVTKIRLLRCCVFFGLLYGVETWTLTELTCKRNEAFEMWLNRRMLKISWTDRITNQMVLERMGKQKELLTIIKARKLEYIGHIRNNQRYNILQLILQGKIEGKRKCRKETYTLGEESP
jgi:hypothetical protein